MGHSEEGAGMVAHQTDLPPPFYVNLTQFSTETQRKQGPPYSEGNEDFQNSPFPTSFNIYLESAWKTSMMDIAEREDHPLYKVTFHSGWSEPRVILHNGPNPDCPELARANHDGMDSKNSFIDLSTPLSNIGGLGTSDLQMSHDTHFGFSIFHFTMQCGHGSDLHIEDFEWHRSYGSEVRHLDSWAWGWKLVRVNRELVGEKRRMRSLHTCHNADETVAVWAINTMSLAMSKMAKFQFLNAGATGELGVNWAVMAVVSALRIWDITHRSTKDATGIRGKSGAIDRGNAFL